MGARPWLGSPRRLVLAVALLGALLTGPGPVAAAAATGPTAADLQGYIAAVEPIRDGVNGLLDTADPLLARWRDHRITSTQAATAMGALEQRFAAFTAQIAALVPADPTLRRIHAPYAHTYLLEDAYLRALAAALPSRAFGSLPRTASQQRAAIVVWRNQVEGLGRALHVTLPSDLQHAGRGDIAPSPTGS